MCSYFFTLDKNCHAKCAKIGIQTLVHPDLCSPVIFARGGHLFTHTIVTTEKMSGIRKIKTTKESG